MEKKDWMVSAVRVGGLARQLEKRGLTSAVLAHCQPQTRAALASPHGTREHAGRILMDLNEAIVKELGLEGFADLNYEATRASYGSIVRPMVLIALTLAGRTPATTLSRIPRGLSEVLPGVRGTWTETGPSSGRRTPSTRGGACCASWPSCRARPRASTRSRTTAARSPST